VHRPPEAFTQSGPMSPRQAPTETRRRPTASSVGTQSRSHEAGFGGRCGQFDRRTRQSAYAGAAALPMQLILPDGDRKWTKGARA
jgi:hypothetical protein